MFALANPEDQLTAYALVFLHSQNLVHERLNFHFY